jgi:hypothetical protein
MSEMKPLIGTLDEVHLAKREKRHSQLTAQSRSEALPYENMNDSSGMCSNCLQIIKGTKE